LQDPGLGAAGVIEGDLGRGNPHMSEMERLATVDEPDPIRNQVSQVTPQQIPVQPGQIPHILHHGAQVEAQ
jgi:hypothetical protein